ncbi:MAG TPA: hypothetical protein DD473_00950 [Planctomycetaceae bacterium]|nr:hypothetical protein [Planctomycetaceae bacterium]
MFRILGTVIGIFSTATLLTAMLVGLYAWGEGNLTRESTLEIAAILKGEPSPAVLSEVKEPVHMTSFDQVVEMRTEKILSISSRESELAILKKAIDDQAKLVTKEREELRQVKQTFREDLDKEYEKIKSESVEQARGILLKMEAESAVEKLLSLAVSDSVLLIKGMAEKDAARILDQFRTRIAGKDPQERYEKAEEIYKAIYFGEPLIEPAERARQAMLDQPESNLTPQ